MEVQVGKGVIELYLMLLLLPAGVSIMLVLLLVAMRAWLVAAWILGVSVAVGTFISLVGNDNAPVLVALVAPWLVMFLLLAGVIVTMLARKWSAPVPGSQGPN